MVIQPYIPTACVQVYLVANLFLSTTSCGKFTNKFTDSSWAFNMQLYQLLNCFGYCTAGAQVKSKKEHTYIVSINFN